MSLQYVPFWNILRRTARYTKQSFVDGNKRIAAALFVCFLQKNGLLFKKDGTKRIDDNAFVALTLMIAASKQSDKDAMCKVILNLLVS